MSILGDIFGFIGSGRAGNAIGNANIAAEHGILTATSDAQNAINAAQQQGQAVVGQAQQAYQPYIGAGNQGIAALQNYAGSNPQFSFEPSQFFNSPAYQFQMKAGTDAIQNAMSAQGLGNSGALLKELTQYGQGVGAQYYNQAFNQAQNTFQTNQNATLQNLGALINAGQFGASGNSALAEFLSNTGMQGQAIAGQQGMQGSQIAGNYAVGAGGARAAGILGGYNNLGNIGAEIVGAVPGIIGGVKGLFGGG